MFNRYDYEYKRGSLLITKAEKAIDSAKFALGGIQDLSIYRPWGDPFLIEGVGFAFTECFDDGVTDLESLVEAELWLNADRAEIIEPLVRSAWEKLFLVWRDWKSAYKKSMFNLGQAKDMIADCNHYIAFQKLQSVKEEIAANAINILSCFRADTVVDRKKIYALASKYTRMKLRTPFSVDRIMRDIVEWISTAITCLEELSRLSRPTSLAQLKSALESGFLAYKKPFPTFGGNDARWMRGVISFDAEHLLVAQNIDEKKPERERLEIVKRGEYIEEKKYIESLKNGLLEVLF